jgi:hypothetical protein
MVNKSQSRKKFKKKKERRKMNKWLRLLQYNQHEIKKLKRIQIHSRRGDMRGGITTLKNKKFNITIKSDRNWMVWIFSWETFMVENPFISPNILTPACWKLNNYYHSLEKALSLIFSTPIFLDIQMWVSHNTTASWSWIWYAMLLSLLHSLFIK